MDLVQEPGWFDRGLWRTVEPVIFKSNRHNVVISIPVGFETDLSSVPRFLPLTWMLTGGTNIWAGVVHDFIYHHPVYAARKGEKEMLPRAVCDDIYDEAGEDQGTPKIRRVLMWAGVRVGGWTAYGD